MNKKYKTGIYIGKFFPIHFGHISAIKMMSYLCETGYVLCYYNSDLEKKLQEKYGKKYDIDQRIKDIESTIEDTNIKILKLEVTDSRPFPENRESILSSLKEIVPGDLDVQFFGSEEAELYVPNKFGHTYELISPYIIQNDEGKQEILHSSLIMTDYEKYKKHIPAKVSHALDVL